MHSLRTLGISILFFCLLAPIQCRRAAGGSGDPVEREAEDALVSYLRIDTSNPPGNETSGARFLQQLLIKSTKADATIFVAWEHAYLVKAVQNIMNQYGGGQTVPAWTSGDYDSLYVVRVNYAGGVITAQFEKHSEGLNGQSTACPS